MHVLNKYMYVRRWFPCWVYPYCTWQQVMLTVWSFLGLEPSMAGARTRECTLYIYTYVHSCTFLNCDLCTCTGTCIHVDIRRTNRKCVHCTCSQVWTVGSRTRERYVQLHIYIHISSVCLVCSSHLVFHVHVCVGVVCVVCPSTDQ